MKNALWLGSLVGVAAWTLGALGNLRRALFAYLVAWAFCFTVAAGALMFTMIGELMRAQWVLRFRRITEALTLTLPLLAALFVPLAVLAPHLYPWAAPASKWTPRVAESLEKQHGYLTQPFWSVRAVIFLASWAVPALLFRRWSLEPKGKLSARRALAAGSAPLLGLTLTFGSFDWLMSLDPTWVDNAYGMYVFSGALLAGIAAIGIGARCTPRLDVLGPPDFHKLGKSVLAMTVFWAYLAFAPMLIIWSGNLPEEVTFYVTRTQGAWRVLSWFLVVGGFFVPFGALLLRRFTFTRPAYVVSVAAWTLFVHYIDIFWLVVPEYDRSAFPLHWLDVAALVAVGGGCAWFASWRFASAPAMPEEAT